jgi:hypothetical protein
MAGRFVCPCCGYDGLEKPAYEKMRGSPIPLDVVPPYSQEFGMPSYEVCACCGFEFGNDDEPGTSDPISFQSYLADWIKGGCVWFDLTKRPAHWSLDEQLKRAGISKGKA